MELERSGNVVTIKGNIKSVEDSALIKDAIKKIKGEGARNLELRIVDSFSMTSTVIGNLMKLVHHDKVQLAMIVGDERLYELLDELNLVQDFNVRQGRR